MWETPVPIPNTTVKTQAADGTALETVWESRWAPDQKKKNRRKSAEYRTGIGSEFCWNKAGTEEIRTLDPLLARQVLSQLSYIPI